VVRPAAHSSQEVWPLRFCQWLSAQGWHTPSRENLPPGQAKQPAELFVPASDVVPSELSL